MKSPANPYVGPRAFLESEHLYGRDRELADLMDLLIAERIILLYSPSGAGKSSLLQAGLIPAMKARGFTARKVIRVNGAPRVGAADGRQTASRYALSMMVSLQLEGRPADLEGMTLSQYLDPNPNGELLVFDQFEEIITTDPFNYEAKAHFFDEIGEALRARGRWAVFAMREDYLARLDPYLRRVPTRLSNTFRLDLLSFKASLEAIRNPATQAAVPIQFTSEAAEKLARDLSAVKVQVDGRSEVQSGQFVEPVQLQVACSDLWERLPEGTTEIVTDDIEKVGNIDQALGAYYAGAVKNAAESLSLAERSIRVWFGEQLITREGIRAPVLKGQGLDSAAVDLLEQAHLVRSDSRMGSIWVELAHDRLISPVRDNNAQWFDQNLSELQKRAELWDQQKREPGLLVVETGKLDHWEKEEKPAAGSVEDQFLKASREVERQNRAAEERRVKDIRTGRILRAGATLLALLLVAASILAFWAFREKRHAQDEETVALSKTEEAKAGQRAEAEALRQASLERSYARDEEMEAETAEKKAKTAQRASEVANSDFREVERLTRTIGDIESKSQLSLLLSVHASLVSINVEKGKPQGAIDLLRSQLRVTGGRPLLGHDAETRVAEFSKDRCWLATGSDDGKMRLWDLTDPDPGGRSFLIGEHKGPVRGLAFSPDKKWLVSGGQDGMIGLWRLTSEGPKATGFKGTKYGAIHSLAISPNGSWLAFGTEKGNVCVWTLSSEGLGEAPCEVGKLKDDVELPGSVRKVLFSAKGRWLATANIPSHRGRGYTPEVLLWDVSADFPRVAPKQLLPVPDPSLDDCLQAFTFSADETRLAVAYGYDAQVWDLTTLQPPQHGQAKHSQYILAVGLSPDNRWLATGGLDARVQLSDLTTGPKKPIFLEEHLGPVRSVVFSDDGCWLATAGDDGLAHLYDLSTPLMPNSLLRGQDHAIKRLLFSPGADPNYLVAMGDDFHARLWTIPDPMVDPIILRGHTGPINSAAVSPDGEWIATSGKDDHKLLIRSLKRPRFPVKELPHLCTSAIAFSGNGRWLATADDEPCDQQGGPLKHVVHLWAFPYLSAKPLELDSRGDLIPYPNKAPFGFSPDSRWLASGTWNSGISANLWDVSGDSPSASPQFPCRLNGGNSVLALAFSPDGQHVVFGTSNYKAYVLDLKATNPCNSSPRLLGSHGNWVAGVAFSPNSRWVATACWDHKGRLFDTWNNKANGAVAELQFRDNVTEVAFSPDGRSVAFGSWDSTIQLLDLNSASTSKPISFTGHDSRVSAIGFSADSKWLVTAGEDHTIRLWDRTDPGATPMLLRTNGIVYHMGFSKDGHWLISAGDDGTLRLWRMMYSDLVDAACQTAGRQLTPEEFKDYLPGDEHAERPCASQPMVK